MRLDWSHEYFDQKQDAYINWLNEQNDRFTTRNGNYVVPAVWFGNEGFKNSLDLVFLPIISFTGDKKTIRENGDLADYFSSIFLEQSFLEGEEVITTHFPIEQWKNLVTVENSPTRHPLVKQVIVGRAIPADTIYHKALEEPFVEPVVQNDQTDELPVVIGVIDEGLAFVNERFRNSNTNSRVEFAWLQDGANSPGSVFGFGYGHELTKWNRTIDGQLVPGIDWLLQRSCNGELVDEDLFYSLAGVTNFGRIGHKAAAWRISHGTHVMDLAAGYEMASANPRRHIISVQLPSRVVADTSGLDLEKFLVDAVAYIFDRAERIAKRYNYGTDLPVVVNFSSGVRAGPHDGNSPIERYLDRQIEARRASGHTPNSDRLPTQIVLPAGNSFQSRSHACFSFNKKSDPSNTNEVQWHVPADDKTHSYVEIWLPANLDPDETRKIGLSISAPGCSDFSQKLVADPTNAANASISLRDSGNGGSLVCKAYYQSMPVENGKIPPASTSGGSRGRYLIALVPTAFDGIDATLATAGFWSVSINYDGSEELDIHAWIHWDDAPIGYSRFGRQSYFEDPFYAKYTDNGEMNELDNERSALRRTGTINAIATGANIRVVGGYQSSNGRVARYSSADFKGKAERPNYLAASETSNTNLGLLAAGTRSGSAVALNGTSVAAPRVARAIAELMAGGKSDRQIEEYLKQKARDDDTRVTSRSQAKKIGTSSEDLPERKGRGRLQLPETRPSNKLRSVYGSEDR
jgi:hypothetical protein